MRNYLSYIVVGLVVLMTLYSCSTTRCLTEGQQRLVSNKVVVTNDKEFDTGEISPYLKQKTGAWSPFLYVYNWQDGKGKGWDKFVKKLGVPPIIYDSLMVDSSIENIVDHLEYLGYYDSDIQTTYQEKKKGKKIYVTYHVELGKRYPIKNITYEVPTANEFSEEFYPDTLNSLIHKGSYLSEALLEAESIRGASVMRNRGYYDFSNNYYFFEADTISCRDSANLKVIVRNYSRNSRQKNEIEFFKYTIGEVAVSYPDKMKFRPRVFQNLNILETGDMFNEKAINNEYSRFSQIGLFSSVNIRLNPNVEKKEVDCDIRLQQSKYQGFKVGLEASINSTGLFGISPEISYYNKNIFHGGEQLDISVSTNHQIKFSDSSIHSDEISVNTSLTFPNFFPFPSSWIKGPNIPKTVVKLAYNYQARPEFKRNMISSSFGYTGRLFRNMFFKLDPLALSLIKVPYMDPEFAKTMEKDPFMKNAYEDHFDLGLNGTLYYSSAANNLNPKESYWYATLKLDLSGNLMSAFNSLMPTNSSGMYVVGDIPYAQYVKVEGSVGKTFMWGDKMDQSLALHFLGGIGYAYGNSVSMPFEKHFYGGGANSLRGWTARSVGPGTMPFNTYWSIPNQTGDIKLEANLEYRFPIFWKFAGAVFLDAGNVWEVKRDGSDTDQRSYLTWENFGPSIAMNWGVGLRLDMSFLVLRVDWGLRIHDPGNQENRWIAPRFWFDDCFGLHFGVGFPF